MTGRCRVICHMMTSIDGKIAGEYMLAPLSGHSGEYYDNTINRLGDSLAGGAKAFSERDSCREADYSGYAGVPVPEGDCVRPVTGGRYLFCFDRSGKSCWNSDCFEYGGVTYTVVEVVTGRVPKPFLARLRSIGVQYIEAGKDEMDIPLALQKITDMFGVKGLVLAGDAVINGAFLKADAVDEISIVVAPYIDGDGAGKTIIDTYGFFRDMPFVFERSNAVEDGGVHLVFVRRT